MVDMPAKLHQQEPAKATPRARQASGKGSPDDVPALATLNRKPNSKKVGVQLKLEAETLREFKVFCASRDLELSQAFVLMFDAYRKGG